MLSNKGRHNTTKLGPNAVQELKINQRRILIDSLEIGIPAPKQMIALGERQLPNGVKVGQLLNSKTLNYKKFTPHRDGLFCERIFGPVQSFVCACGKKKESVQGRNKPKDIINTDVLASTSIMGEVEETGRPQKQALFCPKCQVEYISKDVRRHRLGYIKLFAPVTHIWYLKGRPSYLSLFLGKRKKAMTSLAYCNAFLVEQIYSDFKLETQNVLKNVDKSTTDLLERSNIKRGKSYHVNNLNKKQVLSKFDKDNTLDSQVEALQKRIGVYKKPCTGITKTRFLFARASHNKNEVECTSKACAKNKSGAYKNEVGPNKNEVFVKACTGEACARLFVRPRLYEQSFYKNEAERAKLCDVRTQNKRNKDQKSQGFFAKTLLAPNWYQTHKTLRNQTKFSNCDKNSFFNLLIKLFPGICIQSDISTNSNLNFIKDKSLNKKEQKIKQHNKKPRFVSISSINYPLFDLSKAQSFTRQASRIKHYKERADISQSSTTFTGTFYIRAQTLPFLPSLISSFHLRDSLISFLQSTPCQEDVPIPLYCQIPRRYPLRDVHKFITEFRSREATKKVEKLTNESIIRLTGVSKQEKPSIRSYSKISSKKKVKLKEIQGTYTKAGFWFANALNAHTQNKQYLYINKTKFFYTKFKQNQSGTLHVPKQTGAEQKRSFCYAGAFGLQSLCKELLIKSGQNKTGDRFCYARPLYNKALLSLLRALNNNSKLCIALPFGLINTFTQLKVTTFALPKINSFFNKSSTIHEQGEVVLRALTNKQKAKLTFFSSFTRAKREAIKALPFLFKYQYQIEPSYNKKALLYSFYPSFVVSNISEQSQALSSTVFCSKRKFLLDRSNNRKFTYLYFPTLLYLSKARFNIEQTGFSKSKWYTIHARTNRVKPNFLDTQALLVRDKQGYAKETALQKRSGAYKNFGVQKAVHRHNKNKPGPNKNEVFVKACTGITKTKFLFACARLFVRLCKPITKTKFLYASLRFCNPAFVTGGDFCTQRINFFEQKKTLSNLLLDVQAKNNKKTWNDCFSKAYVDYQLNPQNLYKTLFKNNNLLYFSVKKETQTYQARLLCMVFGAINQNIYLDQLAQPGFDLLFKCLKKQPFLNNRDISLHPPVFLLESSIDVNNQIRKLDKSLAFSNINNVSFFQANFSKDSDLTINPNKNQAKTEQQKIVTLSSYPFSNFRKAIKIGNILTIYLSRKLSFFILGSKQNRVFFITKKERKVEWKVKKTYSSNNKLEYITKEIDQCSLTCSSNKTRSSKKSSDFISSSFPDLNVFSCSFVKNFKIGKQRTFSHHNLTILIKLYKTCVNQVQRKESDGKNEQKTGAEQKRSFCYGGASAFVKGIHNSFKSSFDQPFTKMWFEQKHANLLGARSYIMFVKRSVLNKASLYSSTKALKVKHDQVKAFTDTESLSKQGETSFGSEMISKWHLNGAKEILLYTGGGALESLLKRYNISLFYEFLLGEIQILRKYYKKQMFFIAEYEKNRTVEKQYYAKVLHAQPEQNKSGAYKQSSTKPGPNKKEVGPTDQAFLNKALLSSTSQFNLYYSERYLKTTNFTEKATLQQNKGLLTNEKGTNSLCRRIYRTTRRLKIVQLLMRSQRRPEWMMISILPVLPPDLRPVLQMGENLIVASDLNTLYQRVIYRNNRHYKGRFLDFHFVSSIQRLVQDAVDRLIENGKGGSTPFLTPGGRPLKSLSDILKGKRGRFRFNLLGKRVDFSGRSVIVVSPNLKIHECGLPREIALELYKYLLIRQLLLKKRVSSIVNAKKVIKQRKPFIWDMLREIIYYHPLLLNRAPTLHRLGIQAFQPKLTLGNAILLHPLVCAGFNADFDGDQMGVHLPLSPQARAEAWDLLWSRNSLLSPATGQPILLPSQDMVLGFYYMTALLPYSTTFMPRDENQQLMVEKIITKQSFNKLSCFLHKDGRTTINKNELLQRHNKSGVEVECTYQSKALVCKGLTKTKFLHAQECTSKACAKNKNKPECTSFACAKNKNEVFVEVGPKFLYAPLFLGPLTYVFSDTSQIVHAYQKKQVDIHTPIWLKWAGKFENGEKYQIPLELRLNVHGYKTQIYPTYKYKNRIYKDKQISFLTFEKKNNTVTTHIRTTVGRVLVNNLISG